MRRRPQRTPMSTRRRGGSSSARWPCNRSRIAEAAAAAIAARSMCYSWHTLLFPHRSHHIGIYSSGPRAHLSCQISLTAAVPPASREGAQQTGCDAPGHAGHPIEAGNVRRGGDRGGAASAPAIERVPQSAPAVARRCGFRCEFGLCLRSWETAPPDATQRPLLPSRATRIETGDCRRPRVT